MYGNCQDLTSLHLNKNKVHILTQTKQFIPLQLKLHGNYQMKAIIFYMLMELVLHLIA